jgi:hypothetical protein
MGACVGISDHGGWAIAVCVGADGTLLDRRRIELVDDDLPGMPHHVEGQRLPPREAVALVARVRVSAERHAAVALAALEADLGVRGIALRALPTLPATVEERLTDYKARNTADWVMYREVLAEAARARGWAVHWYEAKHVLAAAAAVLGCADVEAQLKEVGRVVGRPWAKEHRMAMAAAIVAGASRP